MGNLGAHAEIKISRHRCCAGLRARRSSPSPPTMPRQPGIQGAALLRSAAEPRLGQQVEDRLEVVLADEVRAAMSRYGPRELVSPTDPIFVDRRAGLVLLLV